MDVVLQQCSSNTMSKKDYKKEAFTSPKGEEKVFPIKDNPKEDKGFSGKLNDPNVPMRRKNRIVGDGKDWFDTHPDA